MRKKFDVVLCGYYGMGNFGDELLLFSMLLLLDKKGVNKNRIAVLSGDPVLTTDTHGVYSVDRWSLLRVYDLLSHSRSLLLGGGGLFQDSTSIRSCLYYWGVIALSRLAGCSPWVFGNSLGPLRSWLGRYLTRSGLKMCSSVSLRDVHSLKLAKSFKIKARLSPDPVLSLNVDKGGKGDIVFVNLRPWNGVLESRVASNLGSYLRGKGLRAVGIAMAQEDSDLLKRFKDDGLLPLESVFMLQRENFDIWSNCSCAIGMRLHFNVLSSLAQVPSIAVPYDPKVVDFASFFEIPLWDGLRSLPEPVRARSDLMSNCSAHVLSVFSRCIDEVIRI